MPLSVVLETHDNATTANLVSTAFSCDADDIIVVVAMCNLAFSGVPTGGTNIGTFTEIVKLGLTLDCAAWWALATDAVSSQSVTLAHSSAFTTLDVLSFKGANTVAPLDHADASLPASNGGSAPRDPLNGLVPTTDGAIVVAGFRRNFGSCRSAPRRSATQRNNTRQHY